jgi:hypothetical protein
MGYVPAALSAVRKTRVVIQLGGVLANTRLRVGSLVIHDILNDAPNTCSLTVGTTAPSVGQDLRVQVNSNAPVLLFNGQLQTVDLSYEGKPTQKVWPCTAIDDTSRANYKRPFGTFTGSATTVAQQLIAQFAPGFTATHVQAGLPTVSVNFDGTEGMSSALRQIAKLIGGYFYFENLDLHLFQTEATDTPDPLLDGMFDPGMFNPTVFNTTGGFLHDPPIQLSVDDSQLRTRVYGKGHGEAVLSDVLAGDTLIPVTDAVMFTATGGKAIAGTTPEVAPSQVIAYTGTRLGGSGSLVGPGAAPSSAPALARVVGTGLSAGEYRYAYTDVTGSGESLPSPIGIITTGDMTPPAAAPALALASGTGLGSGVYQYAYTDVTADGETLPSPLASITTGASQAPPNSIGQAVVNPFGTGPLTINTDYSYAYIFKRDSDGVSTTISPSSSFNSTSRGQNGTVPLAGCQTPPSGWSRVWYRTKAADATFYLIPAAHVGESGGNMNEDASDAQLGAAAPTTNGTALNQVAVSAIAVGPTGTTQRKLYRTVVNGSQLKLHTTIANNTATTIATDTLADGSLGANAPTSATAVQKQVGISGIAVGASGTTQRKVYRTLVSGVQLKLLTTLTDNTTTTFADSTADASLGANAPTSDTSGLTQPSGQVNAGSTSVVLAGAGPFNAAGGWAIPSSGPAFRYFGISGNTLTGIPPSGPGSLVTTVLYGSPVLPAPSLTGVTGLTRPMSRGVSVNIWVQRDDVTAQAERIALDAAQGRVSDGVVEGPIVVDERRGEASLTALCDATLTLFSRPLVTITYATRDTKTKSGKTIVVNLTNPPIGQTLTIQDVTITEIDLAPRLGPKYAVTASNVQFSLEDLLRRSLT